MGPSIKCPKDSERLFTRSQMLSSARSRDGHGIPKCSPCPSVGFLMLLGPSVRFCVFWGVGEYVCPSYGPLKFLKSAKSGRKFVRPFV